MLALFNCKTVLHVLFWFDCGDGRVFDDIFFLMNMFVFYLLFSLLDLRMLLELFVLGHVGFVWSVICWLFLGPVSVT